VFALSLSTHCWNKSIGNEGCIITHHILLPC
jgi:hypothetical protein